MSLHGLSATQAAHTIAALGIHVLVDLNGLTMHSGLPILARRPAPVQISHLGFPMSTGAPFIDYFLTGDAPLTPPDDAGLEIVLCSWERDTCEDDAAASVSAL